MLLLWYASSPLYMTFIISRFRKCCFCQSPPSRHSSTRLSLFQASRMWAVYFSRHLYTACCCLLRAQKAGSIISLLFTYSRAHSQFSLWLRPGNVVAVAAKCDPPQRSLLSSLPRISFSDELFRRNTAILIILLRSPHALIVCHRLTPKASPTASKSPLFYNKIYYRISLLWFYSSPCQQFLIGSHGWFTAPFAAGLFYAIHILGSTLTKYICHWWQDRCYNIDYYWFRCFYFTLF